MANEMMTTRPQTGVVGTDGFGRSIERSAETAASAVAARAQAEIQAAYIMALQRPRDLSDVRIRLLSHCRRHGFAERARYAKPVGGKKITGASIRFCEAALAEYGNCSSQVQVVFEDSERMIIRVTVVDLERNIPHSDESVVTKRVERRQLAKGQKALAERVNTYGDPVFIVEATDDDMLNRKGSAASKLLRNLALRLLPADLVDEAMDVVIGTLASGVKADPQAAKKALMDSFAAVGVMPKDVVEYLGHSLDAIQPAELMQLREIYTAIRDGETSWRSVMTSKREEDAESAAEEKQADKAVAKAEEKAEVASKPAAKGAAGLKGKLANKPRGPEPKTQVIDVAPKLPLETDGAPPPEDDIPEWKEVEQIEKIEAMLERVHVDGGLFEIVELINTLPAGDARERLMRLANQAAKQKG